jgi:hypothetical protein
MFGLLFGFSLYAVAQEPELEQKEEAPVVGNEKKEKKEKEKENVRWKVRPVIDPTLNLHTFNTDTNTYYGVNFGAGVGARYQQKKRGFRLQGMTRAQYVQTWAPSILEPVSGQDIRIGSFIGPWWRIVGFQVGPDLVYNTYDNPGVEATEMIGVAPVASAIVDLRIVSVSATASPTFYLGGNRPGVDWNQYSFTGVGDEFTFSTRAGVDLFVVGCGVSYTRRYSAFGEESRIGFDVSIF